MQADLHGIQAGLVINTDRLCRTLNDCTLLLPLNLSVHISNQLCEQSHQLSLIPIPGCEKLSASWVQSDIAVPLLDKPISCMIQHIFGDPSECHNHGAELQQQLPLSAQRNKTSSDKDYEARCVQHCCTSLTCLCHGQAKRPRHPWRHPTGHHLHALCTCNFLQLQGLASRHTSAWVVCDLSIRQHAHADERLLTQPVKQVPVRKPGDTPHVETYLKARVCAW